jgi:hypothetical protein
VRWGRRASLGSAEIPALGLGLELVFPRTGVFRVVPYTDLRNPPQPLSTRAFRPFNPDENYPTGASRSTNHNSPAPPTFSHPFQVPFSRNSNSNVKLQSQLGVLSEERFAPLDLWRRFIFRHPPSSLLLARPSSLFSSAIDLLARLRQTFFFKSAIFARIPPPRAVVLLDYNIYVRGV